MNKACQELKESFTRNEAVCSQVNHLFHLLSNKGRFRIVCLLCLGEFCVNDIAEVVGQGHLPNLSQHLKMLALSGVVEGRRESQRIIYRLKDERVRKIIGFMRSQFLEGGRALAAVDGGRRAAGPTSTANPIQDRAVPGKISVRRTTKPK